MTLIERLWAVVTSFITWPSISSWSGTQAPLQPMLPLNHTNKVIDYPIFKPPGVPDDENFQCEYPLMKGWEDCSHGLDRKCWIKSKSDGKQFDINTDYEKARPTGIERYYNIDLADSFYAADGLNFTEAKLFNKSYPGPWIKACWGDRLIVNVTNSLTHNGTSVHWHGIRQLNTMIMDGVNGITQCPIPPGNYFVYNFTLNQYGSSWYHSHYSVQYADGAAGPITIYGPSSADWDEAVNPPLIITDWYHDSAFRVVSSGNDDNPPPDMDILLNGRGDITRFACTDIKNTTPIEPALNIIFESPRPGQGYKKYLVRVINTSFRTTFIFSIDNHLLQVISADFVPIQPYRITSILVGIGQRYNIVVEANPQAIDTSNPLPSDGNYWIRTQIADCWGSKTGKEGYDEVGILRYDASSTSNPTTKKWPHISRHCSDETYTNLNPIVPWTVTKPSNGVLNAAAPPFGEEFDVFVNVRDPKDYPIAKWTMDSKTRKNPMRIDYSDPTVLHLNPEDNLNTHWPQLWRVQPENYTNSEWIYLVLHGKTTNGTLPKNTNGAHPIHLHGHDFAILEQAEGKKWKPDNMNLKLDNPPRRDVVLLPRDGYVVIAFKADNPGLWLIHCHLAFHISQGLGMQILENQPGAFNIWPDDSSGIIEARRVCMEWKKFHSNYSNWANKPESAGGECKENITDWCFQDDSGV